MSNKGRIKVQLFKSVNGRLESHKACVRGLGLKRIRHVAEVEDTAATRGMINKVNYMVRVVEG